MKTTSFSGAVVEHDPPLTRALLTAGAAAGPVYIVVAVFQMLVREGFDLTRHAVSVLANGDLGWIQAGNFLVAGLLTVAGAAGLRRALAAGRGRTWGPLLLGLYGLGLIGAGLFKADPAPGFPPGTPADAATITTAGLLHFATGGVGFLGLIGACLVMARRFAGQGQRGWAVYSLATGILFFAAFAGIATGRRRAAPRSPWSTWRLPARWCWGGCGSRLYVSRSTRRQHDAEIPSGDFAERQDGHRH